MQGTGVGSWSGDLLGTQVLRTAGGWESCVDSLLGAEH